MSRTATASVIGGLGILALSALGCLGDRTDRIDSVSSALSCTADPECDDLNPCTDDACDLGARLCKHFDNSVTCDDGNACSSGDVCSAGVCIGGDVSGAAGCTSCTAAVVIPAHGGVFNGTTAGTDRLRGSCDDSGGSPERVYAWTPTTSGTVVVSTCGNNTTYDTILYMLSSLGDAGQCTASGELACNDDTGGCGVADGLPNASSHGSRITREVTAGQTYYIVVDGWGGRQGAYQLAVTAPSVCGNDVREGAELCDGTDSAGCVTGLCTGSCTCQPPAGGLPDLVPALSRLTIQRNTSVPAGDVAEGCASRMNNLDLLRFAATTTNIGTADVVLGNPMCPDCSSPSNWNRTCGNMAFTCSGAGGHSHAHYSNYAKYELLDATGTVLRTGHKQGFCLRDSQCTGGATAKYDCDNQGIAAGCGDVYDASLGCQYIDVTGIAAGAYTLRMIVDPFNQLPELNDASNNVVSVAVTLGGAAPAPEIVPASGGTFTGTTSGASLVAGASCEPGATAQAPEHVFQWTPSASGPATISSCSANTRFDTVLYVGANPDGSSLLACNDDSAGCAVADGSPRAGSHGSRVVVDVTAGTTYYIVVDGFGGSSGASSGDYSVTIVPPPGTVVDGGAPDAAPAVDGGAPDSGATPLDAGTPDSGVMPADGGVDATADAVDAGLTVISPAGGVYPATTSGASRYGGTCAPPSDEAPEALFVYRPVTSGVARFSTCSAMGTYDTVLYVRSALSAGNDLACNDDTVGCGVADGAPNASRHGSRVALNVTAGQTYYIVVDGYAGSPGGDAGTFVLTVVSPP